MPIPRKGLRDIPTHRARSQTDLPPYSLYMRIACIEMEKGRRNLERQAAHRRVANAEQRLADLESEKAELMRAMGEAPATPSRASATAGLSRSGLRIQY